MNNGHEPATKADLGALEGRFKADLEELESRLTTAIRDTETKLLTAFYDFARANQHRVFELEGAMPSSRAESAASKTGCSKSRSA